MNLNFRRRKNVVNEIVSGWKNVIFPSKEIEELARVRARICSDCPFADLHFKFKKFSPKEKALKDIKGLGCTKCGCPLSSKVRSVMSSCPEKKW